MTPQLVLLDTIEEANQPNQEKPFLPENPGGEFTEISDTDLTLISYASEKWNGAISAMKILCMENFASSPQGDSYTKSHSDHSEH